MMNVINFERLEDLEIGFSKKIKVKSAVCD